MLPIDVSSSAKMMIPAHFSTRMYWKLPLLVASIWCRMAIDSFLESLPSREEIQRRINHAYDDLFWTERDGSLSPYVCTICDEFLLSRKEIQVLPIDKLKKLRELFLWTSLSEDDRIAAAEEHYSFQHGLPNNVCGSWLKGMALSPRGSIYRTHPKSRPGFTCCDSCHSTLTGRNPYIPFHSIINMNYVGCAPKCLTELNQVELALLSPVNTHGYCFTHTGGTQMNLKGTLSFLRIEERRIVETVAALDNLRLTNHVVVLCHGKMTDFQRKKVNDSTSVNTQKLIDAAKWLCENHARWKDVDYEKIKEELKNKRVIRIDHSETVESTNATVEHEEIFTCYYPEGTANTTSGGFSDTDTFVKLADELQQKNFNVELKANLEAQFVRDNDGDQLVGACLLQFPYGRCGMDEIRVGNKDGSCVSCAPTHEFLKHLSRLSDPEFQKPLLQLIAHSMISRARLLKRSRLQVKGKKTAKDIAEGLNYEDLHETIRQRNQGNHYGGTRVSRKLLDSVQACTRALPHTNEAAKIARSTSETMQHYMGSGSIFLTVTFDDDQSLLMQVLSGVEVDDDEDIDSMADKELRSRRRQRHQIRLKYPGVAALHFEMLLKIMVEEVIGWDMDENKPTGKIGFFGVPEGLCAAMEEQGRKTLHGHMTIWIKGYKELQRAMFFSSGREKEEAEWTIQEYYDRISSTELFSSAHQNSLKRAWDHKCTQETKRRRLLPTVVADQELRVLRHRKGYSKNEGCFARCPHCDKSWTYEELVCGYLTTQQCAGYSEGDIQAGIRQKVEIPKHRCYADVVRYQKNFSAESYKDVPDAAINAVYQSHSSCHTDGCFRCIKNKKKGSEHKCGPLCECRYKMPDRKRARTCIKTEFNGADWFEWNGIKKEQPIVQVCVKRGTYDLFQNICCPAISHSKFACNSNVQLITDGPIGQYQFKYNFKPTQDDDTKEYSEVDRTIKNLQGRLHENDRSEAIRRITRAAFAHNKNNAISPSFASYLTRHDSRFYFSKKTVFCPLKDVIKLHQKETVPTVLKYTADGGCYFENQALHYLCRPLQLEDLSLKDYFERYEDAFVPTKKRSKNVDNPVMPFVCDTGHFVHPSVPKETKKNTNKPQEARQGARCRDEPVWIKVSQWMFPDTSHFHGEDIRTCQSEKVNKAMEQYAETSMALLLPHRHVSDLQSAVPGCSWPYTKKFQEVWKDDERRRVFGEEPIMFTADNMTFLQNIQDCARNSPRYKVDKDDLQAGTEPFHPDETNVDKFDQEDDGKELEENTHYEQFLQHLDIGDSSYVDPRDNDPTLLDHTLRNFDFKNIKCKGSNKCGFHPKDVLPPIIEKHTEKPFLKHKVPENRRTRKSTKKYPQKKKYKQSELVRVLFKKTRSKPRKDILQDTDLNLCDANGSIQSIREWGASVFSKDRKQRRAFEAIIAAFILTFFDDIDDDDDVDDLDPTRTSSQFRKAKLALLKLKGTRGRQKKSQLIALLHGPGGSGKSTVINMVKAYAHSYCDSIGHEFTNRTIIITAMSGVAATLLKGNTTHKVMGLNRGSIPPTMIEEFRDARLLIVDEISFGDARDIEKLHSNCIQLLQNHYAEYGGLNIVFAGDYSQLKPVGQGKKPIYNDYCPAFHGKLTSFIELDGKWRFINDTVWGEILLRFREGCPTLEDIRTINKNCHVAVKTPPSGIQVATFKNCNRDAVNASVFEEYCRTNAPADQSVLESALIIFMDTLEMKNSAKTLFPIKSNAVKKHFYENCAENDCTLGDRRGRVDPMLKLYYDCPLMLTNNTDVEKGQANGSRVRLQSVTLKVGEEAFNLKLNCGTTVRAMYASQVLSVEVKHEASDIIPATFNVKCEKFNFKAEMKIGTEEAIAGMSGKQFPLISNSCTTGHKLQGCTCSSLLVNDWHYGSNWPYVVLSRVKTMAGLYIARPLDEDLSKYEMPEEMKRMLNAFRSTISHEDITDEEYDAMLKDTADTTFTPPSPPNTRTASTNIVTP